MPEIQIIIGGREFEVACQEGEEHYLESAAQLLDGEASVLASQIGRMPESRMLLMAGLMLADKTAGMDEQLRQAEARLGEQEAELENLRGLAEQEPEQVEVPVVPPEVVSGLSQIAARTEELAEAIEARAAQ
ncbi:MAG: cell division protein ZapA [Rhodobacteraceae bacterium]|nr:cell division protein ZapA [Paracoccaceae bacterium]